MTQPEDPFLGTWKMNVDKSEFDANHRPSQGTMHWERDCHGYVMTAEGLNNNGQHVKENPQRFVLDGKEYPVPGAPDVMAVCTRPEPNTIEVEGRREGQTIAQGRYVVSADGRTLTTTISGTDSQQRTFKTVVAWDRQ